MSNIDINDIPASIASSKEWAVSQGTNSASSFTLFPSVNHTASNDFKPYSDLKEMVENPVNLSKINAPCIVPQLSGYKTKDEVLKFNLMGFLCADLDTGNLSKDELKKMLALIGILNYVFHSTATSMRLNKTGDGINGKKWRVLIQITKPISCEKWVLLQTSLVNLLNGDPAAAKITQVMFIPNNPPVTDSRETQHYEYHIEEGEILDTNNLPQTINDEVNNILINQSKVKPIHVLSNSNLFDKEKLVDALGHINSNCEYDRWLKVLMAIYHEFDGSDEGFKLAYNWSVSSDGHNISGDELLKKWDSFNTMLDNGITVGTLFMFAKEEGWDGGKKSFLEVKKLVDDLPIFNGIVDPDEWCNQIIKAELSPTQAEVIINSLVDRQEGSKRALNAELKAYKEKSQVEKKSQHIETARGRRITIEYDPLNMNRVIHETETAMLSVDGRYEVLNNGSFYIRVKVTQPTVFHAIDSKNKAAPDTAIFFIYDATAMMLRIEQSIQFIIQSECGVKEIPVPMEFARHMLLNPEVQTPVVNGLITHPIVYPDGTILINHGFDKESGLYLHSGGVNFIDNRDKVLTQTECANLLKGIHQKLFDEFEFSEDVDASVAMTMLFTGLQRKTLDIAPGFVANANVQASGKTTLARVVYVTLTGSDMPVTSLSPAPNEAKKEITTHLMEQMEMMCIDNEPDGSTLKGPIIAKIVTASEFKGRILGYSKNATVKTNVLLVYTGNNLQVDADLVRRLLMCNLEPKVERPEQRKFNHPDIVKYVRNVRVEILADLTTIIRSYILSGDAVDITPSGYPQWDALVRKPLIWSGCIDPMDSCNKARDNSPDIQGPIALLSELKTFFGTGEFTCSNVSGAISETGHGDTKFVFAVKLAEVFDEYYPMNKRDARGIGAVLKKIIGRRVNGCYLAKRTLNGISQYSVK